MFFGIKYIWQYKRVTKNTQHNGLPNNQRLFTALVSTIGQWSKLQMLVQIGCLLRDACQAKQTETFTDRWWLQPLFLRLLGWIPREAHEGACCRDCFQCEPWMGFSRNHPLVFSKPLYIDFFYDIRYIIYLQFCTNEPLQAKRLLEFVGKDQHTHTWKYT